MMTLLVTLLALWGPPHPVVSFYPTRVFGSAFTLLYPDTLSAMTFLPSLAPRNRGLWFQTDPNMLIFWNAGFFVGGWGSYKRTQNSEPESSNFDRTTRWSSRILLGYGHRRGFGVLFHYQNTAGRDFRHRTLDFVGDLWSEYSRPRWELRISYVKGSQYVLFRFKKKSDSAQDQMSRSLPPNYDESFSWYYQDTLKGQVSVGSVRKEPWGVWMIEASLGASRAGWRTHAEGQNFENDSLTDSFVNESSEQGKIEPEGIFRVAGLRKNETEAYTFYVGIQAQIQARIRSITIQGSRAKEVLATVRMPIAIERRVPPLQFLIGTAFGFHFLYQYRRTGGDVRTQSSASFVGGVMPLTAQVRFSPHLRVGVLWTLWTRSYQVFILYQG